MLYCNISLLFLKIFFLFKDVLVFTTCMRYILFFCYSIFQVWTTISLIRSSKALKPPPWPTNFPAKLVKGPQYLLLGDWLYLAPNSIYCLKQLQVSNDTVHTYCQLDSKNIYSNTLKMILTFVLIC